MKSGQTAKSLQERYKMEGLAMRFKPVLVGAALLAAATQASAQNSSGTPPTVTAPPPASTTTTTTTAAPPSSTSPPDTTANQSAPAAPPVIVQQAPPPVQQAPVTIAPDAAYPNGFADPADPFANDLARDYRAQQSGFDWGLLGLLGLLGLIPLIRGNGRVRTVYVERDDEPRRVRRVEEE
jgi:hypothetical protein